MLSKSPLLSDPLSKGGVRSVASVDALVGQHMSSRRKQLGLSRRELAARARVAPWRLAKYEAGTARPGPETLARVAEALGVPLSFFFDQDQTICNDLRVG